MFPHNDHCIQLWGHKRHTVNNFPIIANVTTTYLHVHKDISYTKFQENCPVTLTKVTMKSREETNNITHLLKQIWTQLPYSMKCMSKLTTKSKTEILYPADRNTKTSFTIKIIKLGVKTIKQNVSNEFSEWKNIL